MIDLILVNNSGTFTGSDIAPDHKLVMARKYYNKSKSNKERKRNEKVLR